MKKWSEIGGGGRFCGRLCRHQATEVKVQRKEEEVFKLVGWWALRRGGGVQRKFVELRSKCKKRRRYFGI